MSGENGLPGSMRLQNRPNGLPEFLTSQFSTPSATTRPSVISGVTSNGLSAVNHSANQSAAYKAGDRPQGRASEADSSRGFGGFRTSVSDVFLTRIYSFGDVFKVDALSNHRPVYWNLV